MGKKPLFITDRELEQLRKEVDVQRVTDKLKTVLPGLSAGTFFKEV